MLSLLWQLKVSIYIMGKVEIGIYFCVTADILKKVLLKCFWSSPLPTIWILSKSLIIIGGRGNRKAKFLTCSIYNILAEYSLHNCTFRWALWPMGLWLSHSNGLGKMLRKENLSLHTTKPTKWRAPSKDSNQAGHPPSLIGVFTVHSICSEGPNVFSCGQRRLWSDWADAQADLSLRWAHMSVCWLCHVAAQLQDQLSCPNWVSIHVNFSINPFSARRTFLSFAHVLMTWALPLKRCV